MTKIAAYKMNAELFPISPITDAKVRETTVQMRQARVELASLPVLAPLAGRFAALAPDKLRGGYYTPELVADWLARWALRTPHDTFLEPSFGSEAAAPSQMCPHFFRVS